MARRGVAKGAQSDSPASAAQPLVDGGAVDIVGAPAPLSEGPPPMTPPVDPVADLDLPEVPPDPPPAGPAGAYLPYPVWLVPAPWPQQQGAPFMGQGPAFGAPPPHWPMMPPQSNPFYPAPQMPMTAAQHQLQRWLLVGIIIAVALSHLPWFAYLGAVHGCFGSFIDTCFAASDVAADSLGALADADAVMDLDMLTDEELPIGEAGAPEGMGEAAPKDAEIDAAGLVDRPFVFARIAIAILHVQSQLTADWAQFSQVLQLGTGVGGFVLTKLAAGNGRFTQTQASRWTLVGTCALAFAVLFWAQMHLTGSQTYAVLGAQTPLGYIDASLPEGFLGAADVKAGLLQYLQMLRLADALLLGAALAMPKAEEKD